MIEPITSNEMQLSYARCSIWSPDLKAVLQQLAYEVGIPAPTLVSCRTRRVAHARQEFMRRAMKAGFSSVRVGKFLGLDHSTVIHGQKQAALRIVKEISQ